MTIDEARQLFTDIGDGFDKLDPHERRHLSIHPPCGDGKTTHSQLVVFWSAAYVARQASLDFLDKMCATREPQPRR